jgi:hypothetical protein
MKTHRFTVSRRFRQNHRSISRVPFIRIAGNWLEQAGFPIAGKVQAQVSHGQIILTVPSPTNTNP